MTRTVVTCMALLCMANFAICQSNTQRPVDVVKEARLDGRSFTDLDLFTLDSETRRGEIGIEESVQDFNLFDLDVNALSILTQEHPEALNMRVPSTFLHEFELELVRVDIFSHDFSVIRRSDNAEVDVMPGVHYRGIIKGNSNSIAAISFFEGEVMGLVSSDQGNLVIGKVQDAAFGNKHIIYDDRNVIRELGLDCGTLDDGIGYKQKDLEFSGSSRDLGDCIRLYIEVDYDIYQNKGGTAGATNYAAGLLNEVITLYANESIAAVVSQIVVWNVTSPYSSTSSSGMLSDFKANISSINGDLGQLLSYQASGGIAAGFNGICNSNVDNSLSFSSINTTYSIVPTYSWSVMVVTHEFGHLWGSRHTHACVWNGNNTAIDGCSGQTEGSCGLPGYPPQGGTLMSYCHLQSVGINFNEGFGPQPGNVIRASVANASCTSPCGPPSCTDGIQNGDETGVDCGGQTCPACPTCTDGVQNGGETGVDCGGPDCPSCPCFDNGVTLTILLDNYPEETSWQITSGATVLASGGTYGSQPDGSTVVEIACLPDGCYDFTIFDTYGDGICCAYGVGNYELVDDSDGSVLASGGAFGSSETTNFCLSSTTPTCTDGIQNQGETGVDCGGPCPACPTCNDGIQNQGETGVDCGGPCPACPTCNDGIQNQGEEGVDCGGPCPACPTCNDGIQNQGEEGVDCGGPCPACPTCNDGIQNQGEEGVDCGGPCPPCTSCNDGIQNNGETGVDCGGPCPACPTCTDGIQNQGEEGVDCGGPCPACPTCSDGIQNQGEEDVDCGGPCPACPTCNDGIQNQGEEGVDCGGPCPACPTCTDGIQNQGEEGIDCGGPCPACPGGCTYELINFNNFNSNWGIWNDGGSDCRRHSNDAQYAFGNTGRPVRLRDNTSTSTMTTDNLDLTAYDELTVDFYYETRSMETNEDFWLQISTNGGSSYTLVEEWNRGDEFENNIGYTDNVVIPGPFTNNTRLRFRCDASGNSDWVYIDNVEITGCNSGASLPEGEFVKPGDKPTAADVVLLNNIKVYPNPVKELLNLSFEISNDADVDLFVTDFNGKVMKRDLLKAAEGLVETHLDVTEYEAGVYVLHLVTSSGNVSEKFIVIR